MGRQRRWLCAAACALLVAGARGTEVKNYHPDEDWQEHDHCTAIGAGAAVTRPSEPLARGTERGRL